MYKLDYWDIGDRVVLPDGSHRTVTEILGRVNGASMWYRVSDNRTFQRTELRAEVHSGGSE